LLVIWSALKCDVFACLQVAAAILPEENLASATRAHAEELRAPPTQSSGSAVVVVPETRWRKQWREMQDKVLCPVPAAALALACRLSLTLPMWRCIVIGSAD
jgi:hypothetical protein